LRLDKAFNAFFTGVSRFPKFKRQGRFSSFTYPQFGFRICANRIKLGLIGTVRVRFHRPITGVAKRVTIIKRIDNWYAYLTTKVLVAEKIGTQTKATTNPVGVDLGINSIVALSDGVTISAPKFLKRSAAEIRATQKSFARKKLGSRRRGKSKVRITKIWRKVANR
jgi:putative transposase